MWDYKYFNDPILRKYEILSKEPLILSLFIVLLYQSINVFIHLLPFQLCEKLDDLQVMMLIQLLIILYIYLVNYQSY